MRRLGFHLLAALSVGACSNLADRHNACSSSTDCGAGDVCRDGTCRTVCRTNADCSDGEICVSDTCRTGAPQGGPQIGRTDGDGSLASPVTTETGMPATHRFRETVTVSGSNLAGASAELAAPGGTATALAVERSTDTELVARLPTGLVAGRYTLRVFNSVSEDQISVWLLQGEPGPQLTDLQLVDAVKHVDGDGSGLDADLLDGLHATAFAPASHSHSGPRGSSASTPASSCEDARSSGMARSGVVWVDHPTDAPDAGPFTVWCDQETNEGGWALLYNSVVGVNTTEFWHIPYAQREVRKGRPDIDSNFYDGSMYQMGLRFMDVVEDLRGNQATAMVASIAAATSFDPESMEFFNPTLVSGLASWMATHFGGGWSAPDFDNDSYDGGNCASLYSNVTQHYGACWVMNLGADADSPTYDGGAGPHVSNATLGALQLASQEGGGYSRVHRISRFVRW